MIQSCTSESYSVISPFLPFRLNPIFPSLPLSGRRYLASVPSSPIRIVADADHRVEQAQMKDRVILRSFGHGAHQY